MTKYSKYNNGYVGLIALLIVFTIMAFIAIKQYERLGLIHTKNEAIISPDNTSGSITPIEKAKDIKNVLENRDQTMLNQ